VTSARTQEVLDLVNQQLGAGTVKLASDDDFKILTIPTGLAPMDEIWQGGFPLGRHVMIHGDFSTLKSYIGLCLIASAQRHGKLTALLDTEKSFDSAWAKNLGVDTLNLIMPPKHKMETGEKAIDLMESLIRGGVDLIVVDSVAALLPSAEYSKSMGDAKQLARQADMMSKAMRKLTASMRQNTGVLWINQTRTNPNIMFGSQESVPAGRALQFYCSYIIGLYHAGKAKEDTEVWITGEDGRPVKKKIKKVVGMRIRVDVKKSKLNKPHRETNFVYDLEKGQIDDWSYLANQALDNGLLGYERGKWWHPDDSKRMVPELFRGHVPLEKLKEMLAGTVDGVEAAGSAPAAKKRDGKRKSASSPSTARGRTATPVRDTRSSTEVTTSKSSRSKTPSSPSVLTSPTSAVSVKKLRPRASKASLSSSSRG
jgi:recombination protein RecA